MCGVPIRPNSYPTPSPSGIFGNSIFSIFFWKFPLHEPVPCLDSPSTCVYIWCLVSASAGPTRRLRHPPGRRMPSVPATESRAECLYIPGMWNSMARCLIKKLIRFRFSPLSRKKATIFFSFLSLKKTRHKKMYFLLRLFIPLFFSIFAEFTALYFNFIDFSAFVGKPRAIYPPLYVKYWWTCNFSIRAVFFLCTCIFCSQDVNQPRSRYPKGLLFHELFGNVHHNPICFVKCIVMFRHKKIIKKKANRFRKSNPESRMSQSFIQSNSEFPTKYVSSEVPGKPYDSIVIHWGKGWRFGS